MIMLENPMTMKILETTAEELKTLKEEHKKVTEEKAGLHVLLSMARRENRELRAEIKMLQEAIKVLQEGCVTV